MPNRTRYSPKDAIKPKKKRHESIVTTKYRTKVHFCLLKKIQVDATMVGRNARRKIRPYSTCDSWYRTAGSEYKSRTAVTKNTTPQISPQRNGLSDLILELA